jgi:hypothetical protein
MSKESHHHSHSPDANPINVIFESVTWNGTSYSVDKTVPLPIPAGPTGQTEYFTAPYTYANGVVTLGVPSGPVSQCPPLMKGSPGSGTITAVVVGGHSIAVNLEWKIQPAASGTACVSITWSAAALSGPVGGVGGP